MIVAPRSWTKLCLLAVLSALIVSVPSLLSGCQPVTVEPPPQEEILTPAMEESDAVDSKTPSQPSPSASNRQSRGQEVDVGQTPQAVLTPESTPSELGDQVELWSSFAEPEGMASGDSLSGDSLSGVTPASPSPENDPSLNTAYDTLVTGEFFHTIPPYMNTGQQLVIQAGVSQSVNQAILASLNLSEATPITILDDARFDPLGMNFDLVGDNEAFEIQPVSVGNKPVIQASPETWQWLVTPLKSGQHLLRLTASVELADVNERQQQLVLFADTVPVRQIPGYRWQQFVQNHGLTILVVVLAAAFLFLGWYLAHLHSNRALARQQQSTSSSEK